MRLSAGVINVPIAKLLLVQSSLATQALGAPPLGSVLYRKQVPTVCTWDACEEVRAFEASTFSTHTV